METKKFGTTFRNYAQFENSDIEAVRNKEYQGVYVKNGKSATPESKEGYRLLGYFETFADAHAFVIFLFENKGIESSIMSYNPAKGV